jgi:hypothetical protein
VRLGPLVFFATETGDAWVLDPVAGYAMCLARDRDKQTVHIVETDNDFEIGWSHAYTIDGDSFIVTGADGKIMRTFGYPAREIAEACKGANNTSELNSGGRADASLGGISA